MPVKRECNSEFSSARNASMRNNPKEIRTRKLAISALDQEVGQTAVAFDEQEGAIEKRVRAQMEREFDDKIAVIEKRLQDEQQVQTVTSHAPTEQTCLRLFTPFCS